MSNEMEDFQYRPDMRVVTSARSFIRSLCEVYGSNQGMAIWDHIRKGLGEQIASDIFLGMLVGTPELTVHSIGGHKIEAIKEIRSFLGWGLKESKDFVESVTFGGPKRIEIRDISDERINEFCQNMAKIGCLVK